MLRLKIRPPAKSQSITISGSTRLSEDEKERMVQDAEKFADADKKRREQADKLNEADSLSYQAEKMLADFSDKLTDELRTKIQQGMNETREAVNKKDAELAAEKSAALAGVLKEAGVVIYSQQPDAGIYSERKVNTGANAGQSSTGTSHEKVVDADYEENK